MGTLLAGVLWARYLAGVGGDLSAQWAWADFAARNPGSAYNLSWYGGMHPASYSLLAPALMALLGVHAAAVAAATVSAALLAHLVVRAPVRHPLPVALWGAFAMLCNTAAGRVTFALGVMFGLAAVVAAGADRAPARWRFAGAAGFALLATAASPVAGLFVEVVAAALLVTGRRGCGWALAVPPPAVVLLTSRLFPFDGIDPISPSTVLVSVGAAAAVVAFVPRGWRAVRAGATAYALGTVLTWAVATPIGGNVQRLPLLFAGPVLLSALCFRPGRPGRSRLRGIRGLRGRPGPRTAALALAFAATAYWTVAANLVGIPATAPDRHAAPLLAELDRLGADRGRVEAVPILNHWESWGLVPAAQLARGWNRQMDVRRNPLFYDDTLTPQSYRDWLRRWAVRYVALPSGDTDSAGTAEAALIRGGPDWLEEVWHDENWRLYRFTDALPLADPPAEVTHADAARVELTLSAPGPVVVRVPWSPWLSVQGPAGSCLARDGEWTRLEAAAPGDYRIDAPYGWPRGTPCRSDG
ncbi:MFS transporter [Kitasatospora sp. RG8]|uniref:MFS transporter n=1 Tax=Kitasatospora sp. RG8 TaxID=2820815 RepID=UPI001ADF4273|nr:MFS transporter [Kitasatospora sp. RG8]MBP0455659.1 MFS transporter [Kitasatospora sp. RG8]